MVSTLFNDFSNVLSNVWSCCWDGYQIDDSAARLVYSIFITVLVIFCYNWSSNRFGKREPPLPPGPRGLPLVGNLPFLETDLQRYFAKLAQAYGPIVKLRLGSKLCVVLSSPSLAKEVLRDHDLTFANRDPPVAGLAVSYGGIDIVWSPHGSHWRMLRKVLIREMMSKTSLEASYGFRQEAVQLKIKDLYTKVGTQVKLGEEIFLIASDVILSMLWGRTLYGKMRSSTEAKFLEVIEEMIELLGKPNVSDIFPALARFDIQGIGHRMKELLSWLDEIFNSVVEQKLKMDEVREASPKQIDNKDFLQILLELKDKQDPKTPLTMTQIKALFVDVIAGGTDTTSTTLEWALAEMMTQPDIIRKAQAELLEVVGVNNMVEDSHLSKLHYLDAVLKETLRLHPVVPLLVPHSPSISCVVGGYTVPKGARVFFNIWAMQRDSEFWENPLVFQPERFLNGSAQCDYRGNDFHFLPFGSGRRICAGILLAERMSIYTLASLLHSFDWKLPEGSKLDLAEKFGIILKKATPLVVIPIPRFSNFELYK